jgi:hypothetical protein
MIWKINVTTRFKIYNLNATIIKTTSIKQRIKVFGKERYIILENNYPFFRSKGLKHRRIDWKIIEGSISSQSFIEELVSVLDKHIRN